MARRFKNQSALEALWYAITTRLIVDVLIERGIAPSGKNIRALDKELANHIERAVEDFRP